MLMLLRTGGGFVAPSLQLRQAAARRLATLSTTVEPSSSSPPPMQSRRPHPTTGGLRQLPTVAPANEIVSRARKQAFKVKPDKEIKNGRARAKKYAAVKLTTLTTELSVPLRLVTEGYASVMRGLHPYEAVVADLTVRALEKAGGASLAGVLGRVKDLHKEVVTVGKEQAAKAKDCQTAAEATLLAEEGEAVVARVLEAPDAVALLLGLMEVQKALRKVPVIDLHVPSVVLVGSPNVGKSSIVRAVSSGTPEVNDYPFTTRGVTLGHMFADPSRSSKDDERFQVMDSPGVLAGRSDSDRNEMEALTVASLMHLPTAVIFVADLSGLCGDDKSSAHDQCAVRRELRARFPRRPWLDVVAKADLAKQDGALEMFLSAVRDTHAETQTVASAGAASAGGDSGSAAAAFRASGSVHEVLHVSSFTGEGLAELQGRMRSMLASVATVLRAYEDQNQIKD